MAALPIRTLPDPVLRQKAKRVRTIDDSIKKLVSDMLDTMHADPNRAGVAAPQVGVPLRVIVIGIAERDDIVLINPEIVRRSGARTVTEGCLSVPGYYAEIERSETVTAKGHDQSGKEVRIKAEGLLAQVLEHEIDHLNGTLYVDHLPDMGHLKRVGAEEPEL